MNKVKTLKIAVIVLVIINLVFLTFHFLRGGRKPHMKETPRSVIVKELDLTEGQIVEFDEMIGMHKANIERLLKKKMTLKRKLYSKLDGKDEHNAGQPEIIAELGGVQVELEALHYEHFNQIRKLCTEEQIPKFKKLQKKLGRVFAPPKPPKKRR